MNAPLSDSGGSLWYGVSAGDEYRWALGFYLTPRQSTATRALADTRCLANLSVTRPLVSQPRRGQAKECGAAPDGFPVRPRTS